MSDQILTQVLEELQQMNSQIGSIEKGQQSLDAEFKQMNSRVGSIEKNQQSLGTDMEFIKSYTADIPMIRQAVLDTLNMTKQIDSSQNSFERKATVDLNTHSHSIDILNRRQLKLEADLENLKNR
ncbi:hypothetical protein ACP8HI_10115 [Paenibacillus sp. FA6]|uniref:hypothetical protein n=1 Tax=Paenibacillus sp. FA6 TaxID=3413029 RepID=UPI003F65781F